MTLLTASAESTPTSLASHLNWNQLPAEIRFHLSRKLEGLYSQPSDAAAFSTLAQDKQQALLIIFRRLEQLRLWDWVRRIENVYGLGGVGMSFSAWPGFHRTLARHRHFTSLWATHKNANGGFRERGRRQAVLHFLYPDQANQPVATSGVQTNNLWMVHFDLYNPLASPACFWRHWWRESLGRQTPDWQAIDKALDKS